MAPAVRERPAQRCAALPERGGATCGRIAVGHLVGDVAPGALERCDSHPGEPIDPAPVARPPVGQLDGVVAASRLHQHHGICARSGPWRRGFRVMRSRDRCCLSLTRDRRSTRQQGDGCDKPCDVDAPRSTWGSTVSCVELVRPCLHCVRVSEALHPEGHRSIRIERSAASEA